MPLLPREAKKVESGIQIVRRKLMEHRMNGMPPYSLRKRKQGVPGLPQQLLKRVRLKKVPGIMCSKRVVVGVRGVR
jgi:hypothetical protein